MLPLPGEFQETVKSWLSPTAGLGTVGRAQTHLFGPACGTFTLRERIGATLREAKRLLFWSYRQHWVWL